MKKFVLALAAALAVTGAASAQDLQQVAVDQAKQAAQAEAQQAVEEQVAQVTPAPAPAAPETVQQIQQDVEKAPVAPAAPVAQEKQAVPETAQPAGTRGGDYRYALANAAKYGRPVYDEATTARPEEAPQVSDNAKIVGEDEVRPEGRDYKAAIVNAEKAQGKI